MVYYKLRYALISLSWSPQELDRFLLKEYNYGLFPFALSLAIYILKFPSFGTSEIWDKRNVVPEFWQKINAEISNLENIKKDLERILENLDGHLENISFWDFLKGKPSYLRGLFLSPRFLISPKEITAPLQRASLTEKIYGLGRVVTAIDEELAFYKGFNFSHRRKGRPIKSNVLLVSLWSHALRDGRIIHWKNIDALMRWFYQKIENTKYSSEIKNMPEPEEIRRFRIKNANELTNEYKYLFIKSRNPKFLSGIQVSFQKESPRLLSLGKSTHKKAIPVICFSEE